MNHLSEELINRYIDNEVDSTELTLIKEHLKYCDECLIKLKAQKLVDNQLRNLNIFHTPVDFTRKVMSIINQSPALKKQKNYKLKVIFITVLVLVSILTIYLIGSNSLSTAAGSNPDWVNSFNSFFDSFVTTYNKTFSGKNASIIGSVISFVLLVGSYFVYESHKNFKDKLKRFS